MMSSCANAAPEQACHTDTLTRRALVGGGFAAALWPFAGKADDALEAVKLATGALGYGGASPGAVLRGQIGQPLRLTLANALETPTSFALLGLRVDHDPGFPALSASPIAPGERRALAFTPAEPGFALYGAYGSGADGLFGAILVPETAPAAVDLEAVVVFSGDPAAPRANGAAPPLTIAAPPGGRVRLRLANAAPEGLLSLSTAAKVQVVAIDGQPCEMFTPREGNLPICPTGRFDLLFDLGEADVEFTLGGGPALRIVAKGERAAARPAISALPANPRLATAIALERTLRATFHLRERDAHALWPKKPLFQARRGQPVALTLINDTREPQTLRLEGHVARVLHRLDDGWDPYWRDALYIKPGRTQQVAFVADNPGKWPLASASFARRAQGMATWFQVA
jgi:FtsP/CotA-like multicopper oxidase with cupredoxin domain